MEGQTSLGARLSMAAAEVKAVKAAMARTVNCIVAVGGWKLFGGEVIVGWKGVIDEVIDVLDDELEGWMREGYLYLLDALGLVVLIIFPCDP